MQKAQAGERLPDGMTETIRLQLLKLHQISRNLAKTAEYIFDLMDRGEIDEAQKRVKLFVWPILENEIQKQTLFFVDEGSETCLHQDAWRFSLLTTIPSPNNSLLQIIHFYRLDAFIFYKKLTFPS